MRLSEIYVKEIVLKEFWKTVEEDLIIEGEDSGLKELIQQSNTIIFEKFKINPKDKRYSIVGSARLYLYPTLREAFNLTGTIGDLDMVIPNKEDWINAGLEENWNKGGLYRPTNDGSIEAFNVWDPARAGGAYADVQVRSTPDIIRDSTNINRHFDEAADKLRRERKASFVVGVERGSERQGSRLERYHGLQNQTR